MNISCIASFFLVQFISEGFKASGVMTVLVMILRNSKQQFYEQYPKGFTDADAAGNPFMEGEWRKTAELK